MQWGGRTHFLLAIVRKISEVQELPSFFVTFFTWSLCEATLVSYYYAPLSLHTLISCLNWMWLVLDTYVLPKQVIRYSHYALNCAGTCPYWVTYLRYTAFIVLYPIGMGVGESFTCMLSIPVAEAVLAFV
ncbi:hypothetical protein GIB67_015068 [Kingdonia uniflora]|uniref:Very-long-chain (3R)-3-hydroxyacyl-CoA dehydratase n=1 Tax=Kingdonia uniflora TaxID=39325 RepID=A0A7J7NMR7_9MAGN|nr:hypothetical protein GIB67_015068 [Kingdonia uniflora]